MFSYLRPHHKRTPSTPSSPAEQAPSFEPPSHPVDHGHPQRWQESTSPNPAHNSLSSYESSSMTRIASPGDAAPLSSDSSRFRTGEREPRTHGWDNSKGNTRSRDGFSYNNHQRMQYGSSQRPESAGNSGPANYSSSQSTLSPSLNSEGTSRQKSPEPNQYYVADGQNNSIQTGRRPIGARLPTPPPAENVSKFEPAPSKSGKTRLNLLNPMSLLARRRTSHAIPQLNPEALVTIKAGQNAPENLDFRIRGTVVHDFSAPRPRRSIPYNDGRVEDPNVTKPYQRSPNPQLNDPNPIDDAASGRWSGGNHTPVFTEDFEEEQYPAAGPHVRKANDLTDLPLPKPPYAKGAQRPLDLNSTSKSNDVLQKQAPAVEEINVNSSIPEARPPVPPKSADRKSVKDKRISIDASATPPKAHPSTKKGRSRNVSEVSTKDAIPKHMKSTSSRFSFDMIGAAEQERLLEDRHRQRALEKQAEKVNDDDQFGDFDDEYDYDDMDDDDGLEERIPGVNADLEDDGYLEEEPFEEELKELEEEIEHENEENTKGEGYKADYLPSGENLTGFSFQQSWLTPLSPSSPGAAETPRDANGEVIGFAVTKNSPYVHTGSNLQTVYSPVFPVAEETAGVDIPQGLGLHGINVQAAQDATVKSPSHDNFSPQSFPQPAKIDDDDDLYFDDGIITGFGGDEQVSTFDESVFDNLDTDQYGRPLKPLSPNIPTLYSPPNIAPDQPPMPVEREAKEDSKPLEEANTTAEEESFDNLALAGSLGPKPSISQHIGSQLFTQQPSQGLTQDTLAAYQSALAAAAFNAAANGKFRRDSLPINNTPPEPEDSQPGLVTDSSKNTSHYEPFSPNYEIEDDFDYDDELEDDAIIAAANAEALASDCDGFYGQEFGFYSAPAAQEAEYANGGYFGPRGADGLNRAQSGRIVVREPNLTPITERSEYSNRNSFMSPGMYGSFASPGIGSLASPGLSQLAGLMSSPEYEGGDMSLNSLLKLRRGAWGGSQPSLHSSTAGSPKSAGGPDDVALPPWSQSGPSNPITYAAQGHRRKNSAISAVSETASGTAGMMSEDSTSGSPTVMQQSTATLTSPIQESMSENEDRDSRPKLSRHKHSASAESISYLKEEDPVSGQRWILERRRTAESGEVELLEREVVQGGRI